MRIRSLLNNAISTLPVLGWLGILPILLVFPLYSDEIQWKLINSRLFLDQGKLLYLFPVCREGFLLSPPVSWYPARLLDAAFYADMSDPRILRYCAVSIFAAIILYLAAVVKGTILPRISFIQLFGTILAAFSLGVLPFIMVMNRPEQSVLIATTIACTIPMWLGHRHLGLVARCGLSVAYILLAWLICASHVKGIFLLPAVLASAYVAIRSPVLVASVVLGAGFGAIETLQFWQIRTNCPESPFLMQVFHSLSLSLSDFGRDPIDFLKRAFSNLTNSVIYWERAEFQQSYQSEWLPTAATSTTLLERFINTFLPLPAAASVVVVGLAIASDTEHWLRSPALAGETRPLPMTIVATCLIIGTAGIAGFQSTKNFYEIGLILPLVFLAAITALPAIVQSRICLLAGPLLAKCASVLALLSLTALFLRFSPVATLWKSIEASRDIYQTNLRAVINRCDINNGPSTAGILMDENAYTELWRTRQPLLLSLAFGWWATGIDQNKLFRERNVSYAIGACKSFPTLLGEPDVSQGGFCCKKLSR